MNSSANSRTTPFEQARTHTRAGGSICHGNISVYVAWAFEKEFVYVCDSLTIILEEIP